MLIYVSFSPCRIFYLKYDTDLRQVGVKDTKGIKTDCSTKTRQVESAHLNSTKNICFARYKWENIPEESKYFSTQIWKAEFQKAEIR